MDILPVDAPLWRRRVGCFRKTFDRGVASIASQPDAGPAQLRCTNLGPLRPGDIATEAILDCAPGQMFRQRYIRTDISLTGNTIVSTGRVACGPCFETLAPL